MPRLIPQSEKINGINLLLERKDDGGYKYGQREIERISNLSRPYIKKLATEVGREFERNGIEIIGQLCVCCNCGSFFRKSPSKVTRAKRQFCDLYCKEGFFKGKNHPNWSHGKSANTFSQWVKLQSGYHDWKQAVLERDNYTCQITGLKENLECHHLSPKAENMFPEKAFLIDNGLTVSKDAHIQIHKLIREGKSYEDAITILKEKYASANV